MAGKQWTREEEEKLLTAYVVTGLVNHWGDALDLEGQKILGQIAHQFGVSLTPLTKKIKKLLNEEWTMEFLANVATDVKQKLGEATASSSSPWTANPATMP